MATVTRINYLRTCVRCQRRVPPRGCRLINHAWHCPACALAVLGPPRCRFCDGEIGPDQPRVRMSDRTIAHRDCYFDAAHHEGV